MKRMILSIGLVLFLQPLVAAPLRFSGDETTTRILDQLMGAKDSIHHEVVVVTTISGTFKGKIIAKGNQFVMLEQDTQMQTMGAGKSQKVISQQLIAISSITAIQFEILR